LNPKKGPPPDWASLKLAFKQRRQPYQACVEG